MSVTLQAPPRPLRVLVVDDHPVVVDGVVVLLSRQPGVEVAGSAVCGRDALVATRELVPDVVLLDLRLPDADPARLVAQLRGAAPSCRVLLFTAHPDAAVVAEALAAGASGCLLKDVSGEELVEALRGVLRGRTVMDPRMSSRPDLALHARLEALSMTRREFEVVRLVATGMSNPEIAEALGLARNTVKTYLQAAMQKLDARNRVDAIAQARLHRLL